MSADEPNASADTIVRSILKRVYGESSGTDAAFTRAGMSVSELVKLFELVREHRPSRLVEVGMGSGTSTVVICAALQAIGGGMLTSIDPFQSSSDGFSGAGLESIRRAGFGALHRLVEEPDFLALPRLLAGDDRYDLVLVDGWHSFDYTLVDIFYADLLLKRGGVLLLHDTTMPSVHKAVRFLETHKPYRRLSPPVQVATTSLPRRAWRRLSTALSGRQARTDARARRHEWRMLAAYVKTADLQVPESALHPF